MSSTSIAAVRDRLLILGAGGLGRVVADLALKLGWWREVAFLDDNRKDSVLGLQVVGAARDASGFIGYDDLFVAIGDNASRERVLGVFISAGARVPTLVHPDAVVGTNVSIGSGTVVMAGAVINCGSRIGMGCIVNTGATVDHDNLIHDYVHISPGVHIAGTVTVGRRSWIGIGAAICNNVSICDDCIIGAGAVVTGRIAESGTYVGVPARKLQSESIR